MKCQYFGDKRDLFKYDLLLDLLKAHGTSRFTFVPMLTPDDGGKEGSLTQKESGLRRKELFDFLQQEKSSGPGEHRLLAWRDFFSKQGIEYLPYRDAPPYYTHAEREDYFNQIPTEALKDTCLFIDPDIGIEHKTLSYMQRRGIGGVDKYLFLDDLETLNKKARNAVVIVYQHLQFNSKLRTRDTIMRAQKVSTKLGRPVAYIREADLAFLAFSDSGSAFERMADAMARHAAVHGLPNDSVGVLR